MELSKALKTMMVKVKEPLVLTDTESESIQSFLKGYETYRKEGGPKSLIKFIDPALLTTIKIFELENESAKEQDIYHYLKRESKLKSPGELMQYLGKHIRIDPNASSGSKRLLSLMSSLQSVKTTLGMDETSKMPDDIILPLRVQRDVLLSKLPQEFKADFEMYSKFHKEPTDLGELYKQFKEVEKNYTGRWDLRNVDSKNRKPVTKASDFDDDSNVFNDFQVDHEANLSTNRPRTRSSTKRS